LIFFNIEETVKAIGYKVEEHEFMHFDWEDIILSTPYISRLVLKVYIHEVYTSFGSNK
jgi:hypothetical protein